MNRIFENIAVYRGAAKLWRVIMSNKPVEVLEKQDDINKLNSIIEKMQREAANGEPLCEPVVYEIKNRITKLQNEINQIEAATA